MLKIFDHEFDIDMMDLDVSGPVWERLGATEEKIKATKVVEGGGFAAHEQQAQLFEMFVADLDFVLGEGASETLLGGKRHFTLALKAWYAMCTGVALQYADATKETVALQREATKQFSAARIAKR